MEYNRPFSYEYRYKSMGKIKGVQRQSYSDKNVKWSKPGSETQKSHVFSHM
jgi:hypothetical protein